MRNTVFTTDAQVREVEKISDNVFILKLIAPEIARTAMPGQFCNIKVSGNNSPLLRRPFSICDTDGEDIHFMIQILGEGTRILSEKRPGDAVNILGPLGNGFNTEGDYETAVIVAGGLGAAPFPFFLSKIPPQKKILCFIGGRSSRDIITYSLANCIISTDDGSLGYKGNVVECIDSHKEDLDSKRIKFFACGPNAMLRALKEFCQSNGYTCEASTECAMACGFGICQGCAIEAADKEGYYLVCKDGPVFDISKINFGQA